jgi:hypothetical protein
MADRWPAWAQNVSRGGNMTGSRRQRRSGELCRGEIMRQSAERRAHADQISATVRLVMMAWEIVWALIDEFVFRGTGPRRLL